MCSDYAEVIANVFEMFFAFLFLKLRVTMLRITMPLGASLSRHIQFLNTSGGSITSAVMMVMARAATLLNLTALMAYELPPTTNAVALKWE